MLLPAITGFGVPALVTDKSALAPTAIVDEALLLPPLGSMTAEVTASESVMSVPDAVLVLTFSVNTKVPLAPLARVAMLQLILPVPFTAGSVGQVHPVGTGRDTKVVLAGVAPEKTTIVALAGPLLVTIWV